MKFSEICTFAVIYAAYLAARRGKRSRAATAHYEVRLLENIVNLVYILKTKIYRPGVFRVFYVYEPKKRLVQAPAFVDKVVQHAIVDNLLYDRITRSFILDNYASQKNKGLHFGLDRLKGFFTDYWNKHHTAEGWVLKCDVRHFFASINHDKLKEKLKKLDLEPVVYDLLCIYIDCSALIAKCILNGGKVNIKTAAAGDGGGEYYEPTVAQTALRGKKWEGDVASAAVSTTNANMIDVKITIDDSVGGFTIREMGLFDDDGTLIAILSLIHISEPTRP